eukprot:3849269-Pleurochrysis_carterae.AAC.8
MYMGSIGMMRESIVPLVPSGKRTKRCVRKMDSSSWNCTLPSSDQRMKPPTPERHSMRYVWKFVQCVSASSVLTEKASVCSPTPPAASGNSSPQNSCS